MGTIQYVFTIGRGDALPAPIDAFGPTASSADARVSACTCHFKPERMARHRESRAPDVAARRGARLGDCIAIGLLDGIHTIGIGRPSGLQAVEGS